MNLSLDLLRKRRRRAYVGEWLPSPVPTGSEENPASFDPRASEESPATRYEMLESVSFAFLLALEALTPLQRAVLLLRDVFDYSTEETAEALDISEATRRALEQFLLSLQNRDIARLEKLLADDVVSVSDGGGEVNAALRVVGGRDRVLRLIIGLADKQLSGVHIVFRDLNSLPALLFESTVSRSRFASRYTLHCEVDESGRIRRLDTVLAPNKLTALEPHE